ncbi:lipid droplet-associated hydrolase-like [Onthophagus taurus]|uniref:lipid droplet-associated hydrolase-like n=1 Tax=Onthophagus taurus TaxID=166361 RepID=UPI000C1FE8A9|nr:lipid droplet-associated hydrolase-like [Onthophagus taurus]
MCKEIKFIQLNGAPTKVITWGKSLGEKFYSDDHKELILVIPGNPGVTQLYEPFLDNLYAQLQKPIWIVGHSGHEKPEDFDTTQKETPFNFTLEAQINHKKTFIETYIPKDIKIHLVGHSVGAFSSLKLLEDESIKNRIKKTYFMFPTIEHLGKSKNGLFMTRIIKPIVPIILFLAWIFTLLPALIQIFCIHIYLFVTGIEKHHLDAIVKFVDPFILRNIFQMAYDQIRDATKRPDDKLMKHKDILQCYYAEIDNWVPRKSPKNLMATLPQLDVEISKDGEHCFVLYQSKEMADIVVNWFR